jgi:hypothetical protein
VRPPSDIKTIYRTLRAILFFISAPPLATRPP